MKTMLEQERKIAFEGLKWKKTQFHIKYIIYPALMGKVELKT